MKYIKKAVQHFLTGLLFFYKWVVLLPVTLVEVAMNAYTKKRHPRFNIPYNRQVDEINQEIEALQRDILLIRAQQAAVTEADKEFTKDIEFSVYGEHRHMLVERLLYGGYDENFAKVFCEKSNENIRRVFEKHPGPIRIERFMMRPERNRDGTFSVVRIEE